MRTKPPIVATAALPVMLLAWPFAQTACADDAVAPRYDLPVGRQLTWSVESVTHNGPPATNAEERTTGSIRATIVGENTDGSRRIVFRSATTLTETPRAAGNAAAPPPRANPEYVRLDYADVFLDGRMLARPTMMAMSYPSLLFPLLPPDPSSQRWTRESVVTLERLDYQRPPQTNNANAEPDHFVFSAVDNGPMMQVYQTTLAHTFRFDRRTRVVSGVESRRTQAYGYAMTTTDRLKLKSDLTVPTDGIAALAADYDRLFDAQREYGGKLSLAEDDPANAEAHLAAAEAAMTRAAARATTETVRNELQTIIDDHAKTARYIKDRADRLNAVLNRPAPDWQSSDIDGNPVRLADLRGKVVVLDFWYRACGYCLIAMPQVKQLAADYQDKPVVVLGMNTDEDVNDARFVIDIFALNYRTVRAQDVADPYGVVGFPAMFIIDQRGIVRRVHVGYSATLRADAGKTIDALLAEPATPATPPPPTQPSTP